MVLAWSLRNAGAFCFCATEKPMQLSHVAISLCCGVKLPAFFCMALQVRSREY